MFTPTIFGREPAAVAALVQGVLALAVSFGLLAGVGIKGQVELAIVMGVVIAVLDVFVAYVTRATLLGVCVGLIKALIALGAVYGLTLTVEQTGALIAFLTVSLGLYQRTQTSPSPVPSFDLTG